MSPKLLERWRGEWQARGELAFPGIGRRGLSPALTELQRIAELERKIGHLRFKLGESIVEFQRNGVERASGFDVLADFWLIVFSASSGDLAGSL